MPKEESFVNPELQMLKLANAIGVAKSNIRKIEEGFCFRKSLVLQDLAANKKAELARMEQEFVALRMSLGLPLHKAGPSGSERRKRKHLRQPF